jgi:hypothetical protein
VDRFHEIVDQAYELVVCGRRMGMSCHMALDDLRGIVQTIGERHRGALSKDVRGERFSASELHHDIDEGEGEDT